MATFTPKLLTSMTSKRYADLWLVKYDLEQVHDCCRILIDKGPELHVTLSKALTDSALIRYRRCFVSGRRVPLGNLVDKFSESERSLHQLVIDLANNHIAHSANDYEQAVATVHVAGDEDDGRLRRSGVGAQISIWSPLTLENVSSLVALVKRLGAEVKILSEKAHARLHQETDAMTDQALHQLKVARIASGKRHAGKHRTWPPRMDD